MCCYSDVLISPKTTFLIHFILSLTLSFGDLKLSQSCENIVSDDFKQRNRPIPMLLNVSEIHLQNIYKYLFMNMYFIFKTT